MACGRRTMAADPCRVEVGGSSSPRLARANALRAAGQCRNRLGVNPNTGRNSRAEDAACARSDDDEVDFVSWTISAHCRLLHRVTVVVFAHVRPRS